MFKKVLIAEDQELMNISLRNTLRELGIIQDTRDYVTYCDDALNRIKKAIQEGNPYELLITDLSFDEDLHRQQDINSGKELIRAAKALQPGLKILVFSINAQHSMASSLFNELDIDGYVPKTRGDAKDFLAAISAIYDDEKYHSPNIRYDGSEKRPYQLTELDKRIVFLLSQGKSQKEVAQALEKSLSSVEKALAHLKLALNMTTTGQLIAHCKGEKLI